MVPLDLRRSCPHWLFAAAVLANPIFSAEKPSPVPSPPPVTEKSAQVLSSLEDGTIRISQDRARRWKLRDYVCISRNHREIDCGEVIMSSEAEAMVKLTGTFPIKTISRGKKKIRVAARKKGTAPPRAGDQVIAATRSVETSKQGNVEVYVTIYDDDSAKTRESSPLAIAPPPPPPPAERKPGAVAEDATSNASLPPPEASKGFLGAGLVLYVLHKDLTDTGTPGGSASINSNPSLGGRIDAGYSLSPSVEPRLSFQMSQLSLVPFDGSTLASASPLLGSFLVGANLYPGGNRRFAITLVGGVERISLIRATNVNDFRVTAVAVPRVSLGASLTLLERPGWSWFAEAEGLALFSATGDTYAFRNGLGARIVTGAFVPIGNGRLVGTLDFDHRSLRASISSEIQESLGASLTWQYRIP